MRCLRATRHALTALSLAMLAACGGGGGSSSGTGAGTGGAPNTDTAPGGPAAGGSAGQAPVAPVARVTTPQTKADASRFLAQASFGPTAAEIDRVMGTRFDGWLEEQFNRQPVETHLAFHDRLRTAANRSANDQDAAYLYQSFWRNALQGEDQLGQRVAFALSQIFVVSLQDTNVSARGAASYLDMLRRHAFGNFRQLLEDVSLHPMMGVYLSHRANNGRPGRVPDENYAREVMQLFTIGLVELNPDGTPKTGPDGKPVETYGNDDVTGLAKVFTGWSWVSPSGTGGGSDAFFFGNSTVPNREVTRMEAYASFHSVEEKKFLGRTCPGGTMPAQSLQCGLDVLFTHPNVGPFIGRQLIQRLVTSNPSPAYVARVSAAFADNGQGVRGDMKAVLRAILLDPEARNAPPPTAVAAGKAREPVLRMSAYLRAFDASSQTGNFLIQQTDPSGLGQTPMRAPSVFNFWRPGYTPPNSDLAAATPKLVAPELQSTNETSVTDYVNLMQDAVVFSRGFGNVPQNGSGRDVRVDFADELAIAADAAALIDRVDLLLTNGQMSGSTRQRIRDVIGAIAGANSVTQSVRDNARRDRVNAAVFLTLASPDYVVQK